MAGPCRKDARCRPAKNFSSGNLKRSSGRLHIQSGRTQLCATYQARREGGRGKFSRAPRRLGAPPSLKNTEKGVPYGFFLTSNMHKIHFRPGLRPWPRWGSLRCSPRLLVGWWGDTPPYTFIPLDLGAYRMRGRGPRDNGFPGPAVALDGPATYTGRHVGQVIKKIK